jgi:hypothetical protein
MYHERNTMDGFLDAPTITSIMSLANTMEDSVRGETPRGD